MSRSLPTSAKIDSHRSFMRNRVATVKGWLLRSGKGATGPPIPSWCRWAAENKGPGLPGPSSKGNQRVGSVTED